MCHCSVGLCCLVFVFVYLCGWETVHMGGESWCNHQRPLTPISSSQGWACGLSPDCYILFLNVVLYFSKL